MAKILVIVGILLAVSLPAFAWWSEDQQTGQQTYYQSNLNGGYNAYDSNGYETTYTPNMNGGYSSDRY